MCVCVCVCVCVCSHRRGEPCECKRRVGFSCRTLDSCQTGMNISAPIHLERTNQREGGGLRVTHCYECLFHTRETKSCGRRLASLEEVDRLSPPLELRYGQSGGDLTSKATEADLDDLRVVSIQHAVFKPPVLGTLRRSPWQHVNIHQQQIHRSHELEETFEEQPSLKH